MLEILRHGIDIRRHYIHGVYICMTGMDQAPSLSQSNESICTLHEGEMDSDEDLDWLEPGPIQLTFQGRSTALRLWDPFTCVFAAAIHRCFFHFPIRTGCCFFAMGCDLRTLSHFADILGRTGRLIAVVGDSLGPRKPTQEQVKKFTRRYPWATLMDVDLQTASLECYMRLLGLPVSSKYAFLMGLHPRLGAGSPVTKLAADPQKLAGRIFDFLTSRDLAEVKCLVVGQCLHPSRISVIREIMLAHIDIFQYWKAPCTEEQEPAADEPQKKEEEQDPSAAELAKQDDEAGDSSHKEDAEGTVDSSTAEGRKKLRKRSKEDDSSKRWVFLDIPTENLSEDWSADEVIGFMMRLGNGVRTGLLAKEQRMLTPYFPTHSLLLMKYMANRDQRRRKVSKHKASQTPVVEEVPEEAFPSSSSQPAARSSKASAQVADGGPPETSKRAGKAAGSAQKAAAPAGGDARGPSRDADQAAGTGQAAPATKGGPPEPGRGAAQQKAASKAADGGKKAAQGSGGGGAAGPGGGSAPAPSRDAAGSAAPAPGGGGAPGPGRAAAKAADGGQRPPPKGGAPALAKEGAQRPPPPPSPGEGAKRPPPQSPVEEGAKRPPPPPPPGEGARRPPPPPPPPPEAGAKRPPPPVPPGAQARSRDAGQFADAGQRPAATGGAQGPDRSAGQPPPGQTPPASRLAMGRGANAGQRMDGAPRSAGQLPASQIPPASRLAEGRGAGSSQRADADGAQRSAGQLPDRQGPPASRLAEGRGTGSGQRAEGAQRPPAAGDMPVPAFGARLPPTEPPLPVATPFMGASSSSAGPAMSMAQAVFQAPPIGLDPFEVGEGRLPPPWGLEHPGASSGGYHPGVGAPAAEDRSVPPPNFERSGWGPPLGCPGVRPMGPGGLPGHGCGGGCGGLAPEMPSRGGAASGMPPITPVALGNANFNARFLPAPSFDQPGLGMGGDFGPVQLPSRSRQTNAPDFGEPAQDFGNLQLQLARANPSHMVSRAGPHVEWDWQQQRPLQRPHQQPQQPQQPVRGHWDGYDSEYLESGPTMPRVAQWQSLGFASRMGGLGRGSPGGGSSSSAAPAQQPFAPAPEFDPDLRQRLLQLQALGGLPAGASQSDPDPVGYISMSL